MSSDNAEVIQGRLGWEPGDVSEADPENLRPHPKNKEIYGDTESVDDLDETFKESVAEKGVLEPLVVTNGKQIISGHRRWLAARATGLESVPVRYTEFDSELAEREALVEFNRKREKTPGQIVNEFEEILKVEKERAKERKEEAGKENLQNLSGGNVSTTDDGGKAREKAAEKVNADVSGRTLEKGKTVKEKAESDDVPEPVREAAAEKWEELQTGDESFSGAYDEVKRVEKRTESRQENSDEQWRSLSELVDEYGVTKGDLWRVSFDDSQQTIYCGDAMQGGVLDTIGCDTRPDLAFVDPPYGVDEDANRGEKKRGGLSNSYNFPDVAGDTDTSIASAAHQQLSDMGVPLIIMWGANNYANRIAPSSGWIVWDKRDGVKSDDNSDFELAWTNQDRACRMFRHLWKGAIKASENTERRTHPTQKPVALANWCINDYARRDIELVYDPFCGSGSTLVATARNGVDGVGVEIVPEYVAAALNRLESEGGDVERLEVCR